MSVFIRTPNLCLPMDNSEISPEAQEAFKDVYEDIFEKRNKTFAGFHYDFDYEGELRAECASLAALTSCLCTPPSQTGAATRQRSAKPSTRRFGAEVVSTFGWSE